jgi:hypothetical protein
MQPNTDRADSATVSQIGGGTGDYDWSPTTQVASTRLDPTLDNHSIVEAGWAGYPTYTPGVANYLVTAASGNGTTVTYTAQNSLSAGNVVTITGLAGSAYNLTSATVATANATKFTVTNAANAGEITGQRGRVELSNALDLGDGAGIGNIIVPNVLGLTIAIATDALRDAGYEAANITTAAAYTPAVDNVELTSNVATLTTAAAHGFAVGDSVVIAGLTDTTFNGTHTLITGTTGSTLVFALEDDNVTSAADSGTAKVAAKAGTIFSQSTAAGTADVPTTATITVTPYYAS